METVLHVKLGPVRDGVTKLRYFGDNENLFTERPLEIAAVQSLVDAAETDYYVSERFQALVEVGRKLYDWLDSADGFLRAAIEQAPGDVLAVMISVEGKLAHLPWETLHDGTTFLVERRSPRVVPVRWKEKATADHPTDNRALRVLFMAASPEDGGSSLDFEREEGLILDATHRQPIQLTVEESGNLGELAELVLGFGENELDVVHLTGHATHAKEGPRFVTESLTGEVELVSAEDVSNALPRKPKLVFLSGCRTGEAMKAGDVPSMAERLIESGFKTVLGWGRPVLDGEASQAAAVLYHRLAAGDRVATALSETYAEMLEKQARDWHLLRLYVGGALPGAFVTPLKTPNRKHAPAPTVTTRFLDPLGQRVKVPTRAEFVGRRRALQRCLKVLRNEADKLGVMLHGMGGLGKSSLAARLCDRMPDHAVVIWFGDVDGPAIANKLAANIKEQHLREKLLDDREDLKFRLWTVLDNIETPFLFVLDDFEQNFETDEAGLKWRDGLPVLSTKAKQVLEALAFAVEKTNGRHRVILTTRYAVNTSEAKRFHPEPLDGLRDADLRKKIRRITEGKTIAGTLSDARARAVELADGNPRLLEWLFALLTQPDVDVETILDRMDEKEAEFREKILAEELLRQQSEDVRRMLARVSLYELPVPRAAVDAVCTDVSNLDKHLERAAALGLLEITLLPDEKLFRVPRILSPLLELDMPDDLEMLHLVAAETLFRIWWKEAERSSEIQRLEIHRLAMTGKAAEIAVEIADRLSTLWTNQSRFAEAVALCAVTLTLAQDNYRLLHNLARAEQTLGNTDEALKHFERALNDCPDDNPQKKSIILHNLAGLYVQQGQVEKAMNFYQESLELETHEQGRAATLHAMAIVYAQQGKIDEAMRLYRESLDTTERIGDVKGKAATLHAMAIVYADQGKIDEAMRLYRESLDTKERIGDVRGEAATLHQMAGLYAQQGKIDEAMRLYRESLDTQERIGDVKGKAATLAMMGTVYAEQGQVDKAMEEYRKALDILERIDDVKGKAATLHQMAGLYAQQGKIDEAMRLYQESAAIEESIGNVQGKAATLHQMAGLYGQQGKIDEAMRLYRESLDTKERIGDVKGKAATLHQMASVYVQQGKIDEAMRLYRESLDTKERIGDVKGKAATLAMAGQLLASNGDFGTAIAYLQESEAILAHLKSPDVETV